MSKIELKKGKLKYRQCPYCKRAVPSDYDYYEHKKICKNVSKNIRGITS